MLLLPGFLSRAARHAGWAALATVLLAGPCVRHAHGQLLQYTFNDTGTATTNTGSAASSNLTFENAAGTATDLHSASGGGVSGLAGDEAFNNTASTTQGGTGSGAGTGGTAFNTTTTALSGLGALTLTGWYDSAAAPFGTGARLIISGSQALTLNFNSSSLSLLLTTTGTSNTVTTSNAAANAVGSWVFFAATYDGTSLKLYLGTTAGAAASVATVSASGNLNVGNGLYLGNVAALNRPFDGSMDDVRFYNSALTVSQIQAIQTGDLANVPEPSSLVWLSLAALGGILLFRRLQSKPAR